ncbi:MAG TPA: DUF4184 family protein [Micromonospora sp.]|nr:DUF4184 family protein [Micromonospora sp.]
MPLTFPSHLAAVLPLKLWRPRWFDGVALLAGAVAPDVAYLVLGTRAELPNTHTLPALFWWCLPVALAYAWIIRRASPTIAVHLPRRWRSFGVVGQVRHPWWITVISALLGAATHIGWDWLTHTDGWLRDLFGLDWYAATGVAWWTVSDLASTVFGGLVAVMLLLRVGRRLDRVGTGWRAPSARPLRFWRVAGVVGVAGLAALPFLPAAGAPAATGVRLLHLAAAALLAAALPIHRDPWLDSDRWEPYKGFWPNEDIGA